MNPEYVKPWRVQSLEFGEEQSWEESRLSGTEAQSLLKLLSQITYLGFSWVQQGKGIGQWTWTSSPGSGCVLLPAQVPSLQLIVFGGSCIQWVLLMHPFSSISLKWSPVTTAEPDILLELRSTVDSWMTHSLKSAYNIRLYSGLFASPGNNQLQFENSISTCGWECRHCFRSAVDWIRRCKTCR